MRNRRKKICLLMSVLLIVSLLPMQVLATNGSNSDQKGITLTYGEYTFSKVSNPNAGSGKPDGCP